MQQLSSLETTILEAGAKLVVIDSIAALARRYPCAEFDAVLYVELGRTSLLCILWLLSSLCVLAIMTACMLLASSHF